MNCSCGAAPVVALKVRLSRDELPCAKCGGQIVIDKMKAPREAMHLLRRWVDEAYAIETLWFASGDYADWAKGELDNAKSKVVKLGLDVAKKLPNAWLIWEPHAGARQAVDKYLDHCPACHDPTEPTGLQPAFGLGCAKCRVAGSAV